MNLNFLWYIRLERSSILILFFQKKKILICAFSLEIALLQVHTPGNYKIRKNYSKPTLVMNFPNVSAIEHAPSTVSVAYQK